MTESQIDSYGARKGVVDTAVRTSDAGYLTRRLVEVVQHIIVRRTDCGTIRGIYVSPQNGMTEKRFVQTLLGRVLAEDIYIGLRCLATRNRIGLMNRFRTFRAQKIDIRTPLTCRRTSWICQCSYGRSPYHGDLVELGGIIAGQSIGTQLRLRTLTVEYEQVVLPSMYERILMEKLFFMRIWFIPHVPVMGIPLFYVLRTCMSLLRVGLHNVNIPLFSALSTSLISRAWSLLR